MSIVLEAPDWMRYLSDNRSPDQSCKLAMIAVPGLQRGKTIPFYNHAWLNILSSVYEIYPVIGNCKRTNTANSRSKGPNKFYTHGSEKRISCNNKPAADL